MPDLGKNCVDNFERCLELYLDLVFVHSYSKVIHILYAGLRSVLPLILLCDQGRYLSSSCRGLAIKVCPAPPPAFSR